MKKIFSIFLVIICIFSLSLSALAVEQPDIDTGRYTSVVSPLSLDTLIMQGVGNDVFLPSPFYSAFVLDGYNLDYQTTWEAMYKDDGGISGEAEDITFEPGTYFNDGNGKYRVAGQFLSSRFTALSGFTLTNSKPFLCNINMLADMSMSTLAVPANGSLDYEVYISGYYPVGDPNSGYTFTSFNQSVYESYLNTNSYAEAVPMFPLVSAYDQINSVIGTKTFIIDKITVHYEIYVPNDLEALNITMFMCEVGNLPSLQQFNEDYALKVENIIQPGQPGSVDFDLGAFMRNSVGAFLDLEIMPGVSLSAVLATVFGIMVFFAFLKIFAGG